MLFTTVLSHDGATLLVLLKLVFATMFTVMIDNLIAQGFWSYLLVSTDVLMLLHIDVAYLRVQSDVSDVLLS